MTKIPPFKLKGLFVLEYESARKKFPVLPIQFPGVTITDAANRLGACYPKINPDGSRGIKRFTFSQHVVDTEILSTIKHEIAHAINWMSGYKCNSHGEKWEYFCEEIGGEPSRLCPNGIEPEIVGQFLVSRQERKHQTKYEITCNSCGKCWKKKHCSKMIRGINTSPNLYRCPQYGPGTLSVQYIGGS